MESETHQLNFSTPKESYINLTINEKSYTISSHLSLEEEELYFLTLETDGPKSAIAAIICKKLKNEPSPPSLEDLCQERSAPAIAAYVTAVTDSQENLLSFYQETDEALPPEDRFQSAFSQYMNHLMEGHSAAIAKAKKRVEDMTANIARSFVKMSEYLSPLLTAFQENLIDILAKITVPTYTDEDKRRLMNHYIQWGALGWTTVPAAPYRLFRDGPSHFDDPHKALLAYCPPSAMETLFQSLRHQRMNHKDLNSAIFNYQQKHYKACALLLFSLIDARLIRDQPKQSNRLVGARAVKKWKEKKGNQAEQFFFANLSYLNLTACLEALFAKSDNFQQEPATINRNFLAHGMNTRPVRKRDCIQLFLALHNLLSLYETM